MLRDDGGYDLLFIFTMLVIIYKAPKRQNTADTSQTLITKYHSFSMKNEYLSIDFESDTKGTNTGCLHCLAEISVFNLDASETHDIPELRPVYNKNNNYKYQLITLCLL